MLYKKAMLEKDQTRKQAYLDLSNMEQLQQLITQYSQYEMIAMQRERLNLQLESKLNQLEMLHDKLTISQKVIKDKFNQAFGDLQVPIDQLMKWLMNNIDMHDDYSSMQQCIKRRNELIALQQQR